MIKTQVKVFNNPDLDELKRSINDWLSYQEFDLVDIKFVTGHFKNYLDKDVEDFSAMVIYREMIEK